MTLSDVARAVGVSAITVSRALRAPGRVSPELRGRILEAVERMGYVPDLAARALASRDSGVIGLVMPTLTHVPLLDVMTGIEDRLCGSGFGIQYANTRFDQAMMEQQVRTLLAQRPSGLIFVGVAPTGETLARLRHAPCPIVQISDLSSESAGAVIGIDTELASRMATRHMLDKGYRRIALVDGRPRGRGLLRREGYENAMRDAGLHNPAWEIFDDAPSSVSLGSRFLRHILDTVPGADGAFCHNDDLALGILFECQRLGIRVPQDFGICGFNDLDYAAMAQPSLTTVHVPRYDLGKQAADMMIRAIRGTATCNEVVDIGFTLFERQSTQRDRPAGD